jgi:DNA (cytosine-5)-methyltransferase 1
MGQLERPTSVGTVVELFAGVGGFRLGLERSGWQVIWSNQWEPGTKVQHASQCYQRRFQTGTHVCEDITVVLDSLESGENSFAVPDRVDLVVGGFPCQDYSVAKTASHAHGIEGKKGVLWWQIHRLLEARRPRFVFLENVDRLLKSPAKQRGRDFAIMLATMSDLGYMVEWRVVNAADYGFPQKRRRAYIVGTLLQEADRTASLGVFDGVAHIEQTGVLARALPVRPSQDPGFGFADFRIEGDAAAISVQFNKTNPSSPFHSAGVMLGRQVWTRELRPDYRGVKGTLRSILVPESGVAEEFFVEDDALATWRYLKGAKKEPRRHSNGELYHYTEGAIPFPDHLDEPARTILTGEGGASPSRFKHLILTPNGRYRRLTPVELERLDGFPDGWTEGMPDTRRAFCMGNALVVGVVERIGRELAVEAGLIGTTSAGRARECLPV